MRLRMRFERGFGMDGTEGDLYPAPMHGWLFILVFLGGRGGEEDFC